MTARLADCVRSRRATCVCALAERKGAVPTPRLQEFRWLLEELRVSLFAQELRTRRPVSVEAAGEGMAHLRNWPTAPDGPRHEPDDSGPIAPGRQNRRLATSGGRLPPAVRGLLWAVLSAGCSSCSTP